MGNSITDEGPVDLSGLESVKLLKIDSLLLDSICDAVNKTMRDTVGVF